jgi:catalase (peroxidase I)
VTLLPGSTQKKGWVYVPTWNLAIISSIPTLYSLFVIVTTFRPSFGILQFPFSIGTKMADKKTKPDLATVRSALTDLIATKKCGPILVRLAWHDSGTWDKDIKTGGPRGCMRLQGEKSEANFGANAGLEVARDLLKEIAESTAVAASGMSNADLWALAACVAVKDMGGPEVTFRQGRKDAESIEECVEEGRHPDADKGCDHLRKVFYRMGLDDRGIVALSGAHTVGSCHADRSGFEGPWTAEPLKFDNSYFVDLLEKKWVDSTSSKGCLQKKDEEAGGKCMMLISDVALLEDEKMKAIVEEYAKDQSKFFDDYAKAFQKLLESGVEGLE